MSDDNVGFNACENLPDEIKSKKLFVNWRFTPPAPGQTKPRKVPFYANGLPRSGTQGDANDLAQLATYAEVVAAGRKGGYTGIGIALVAGCDLIALDFDNVVDKDGAVHPGVLEMCEGTYAEYSPSGTGYRAFFTGALKSRKDTTGQHGDYALEVFGDSGFVTITGNVSPDCALFGYDSVVAPITPIVLAEYAKRWGNASSGTGMVAQSENDAWLLALGSRQGWTITDVHTMLADCDPSCDRDHWLKTGMAIHHELEGSDEAFDLYDEWSARGKTYQGTKDVMGRWRSFGRGGSSQITGVWLKAWHKECLKRKVYLQVDDWKAKIKSAGNEYDLREKVCTKIKQDQGLGDIEREMLAQALADAFKAMGVKLPIAQCRKLLIQKLVVKNDQNFHTDESAQPDWLQGYVFVTDDDKFYRKESEEWLTVQGFNSKYNRHMPRDEHGMVTIAASVMALEQYQIMTVTRGMYIPWAAPVFREEGSGTISPTADEAFSRSWMVNTYRPSAVPVAVESLSPEAIEGIKIMLFHIIDIVCGGRQREGALVISSMAHNVQNPGIKQRWAPLIQGIEGDGKSLIGTMLSAVMGAANIKSITPTVIARDFTSWAHGSCVAILEELRITGHNKHEIHNRVKPMITNDRIEIHPKGKDAYDVINTQNYFAFTNYKDAIPLTDDDRRFMVIYSRFATKEDLNKYLEKFGGNDAYFEKLHHAISKYGREFRRFLLDYKMHPEFSANGRAPDTTEKRAMAAFNKSDDEMLFIDIVEQGAIGVSKNVLCSSYLRKAAQMEDGDTLIDNNAFNRVLIKMGFNKWPKVIKWNNKTDRFWYRGSVAGWGDEARLQLDATLPDNYVPAAELFGKVEKEGGEAKNHASEVQTDIWGDPLLF